MIVVTQQPWIAGVAAEAVDPLVDAVLAERRRADDPVLILLPPGEALPRPGPENTLLPQMADIANRRGIYLAGAAPMIAARAASTKRCLTKPLNLS